MHARDTSASSSLGALGRLTGFVLPRRRWVVGFWLVMLVAGGLGASHVSQRLTFDFSLPGQPGYEAAQRILRTYGNGGELSPTILVVDAPRSVPPGLATRRTAAGFAAIRRALPGLRVVDYGDTGDHRFLTAGGRSSFGFVFPPPGTGFAPNPAAARAPTVLAAALPAGYQVSTTGLDQLSSGSNPGGPSVLVETLIAAGAALAVLAFVFGSLLALLPLLIAGVAITSTLLAVLGLTYLTSISFVVQFLIALVGLGVAIDYSLLVVTRWREERAHGRDNEAAITVTMQTAGRAVLFSGLTVGIGLMALIVLPVPGLRSIGIGGMLIPLISVLVTLTLLPAVLAGFGRRLDWPRLRHEDRASRPWSAWARMVVRRRWIAAGAALVVLGLLIVPVFGFRVGETGPSALATTGPAHASYQRLVAAGVPAGVLTPVEVIVGSAEAGPAAARMRPVTGVWTVAVPTAPDSNRRGTTVLVAVPQTATVNSTSSAVVTRMRDALAGIPGVGVAGVGAIQLDYVHAVFGHFPLMLAVIAALTYLLLARAFRSLLLPAKAVAFNLISLAAAFGVTTWFWQEGHGSQALFGIPATGAITFWVPLMIFAFLFGLSMDYEVFILSRMREEYDRTGSTSTAVVEGLGRTGRLVTSAALILFFAFASLASAPDTDIKVFATALGAGILLDATLVRALLLPSLVAVLGRWNWWLPRWLARPLRVAPAPLAPVGALAPVEAPVPDGASVPVRSAARVGPAPRVAGAAPGGAAPVLPGARSGGSGPIVGGSRADLAVPATEPAAVPALAPRGGTGPRPAGEEA